MATGNEAHITEDHMDFVDSFDLKFMKIWRTEGQNKKHKQKNTNIKAKSTSVVFLPTVPILILQLLPITLWS